MVFRSLQRASTRISSVVVIWYFSSAAWETFPLTMPKSSSLNRFPRYEHRFFPRFISLIRMHRTLCEWHWMARFLCQAFKQNNERKEMRWRKAEKKFIGKWNFGSLRMPFLRLENPLTSFRAGHSHRQEVFGPFPLRASTIKTLTAHRNDAVKDLKLIF